MPAAHQIHPDRLTGADQVPQRLFVGPGYPNQVKPAGQEQPEREQLVYELPSGVATRTSSASVHATYAEGSSSGLERYGGSGSYGGGDAAAIAGNPTRAGGRLRTSTSTPLMRLAAGGRTIGEDR